MTKQITSLHKETIKSSRQTLGAVARIFVCNPAYKNSELMFCFPFHLKTFKCILFMFLSVRL